MSGTYDYIAMVYAAKGSATQKIVLLVIAIAANEAGVCWPSQELIAARVGLSERSVRDALRYWEEQGYLETRANYRSHVKYGSRRVENVYTLTDPNRQLLPVSQPAAPAGANRQLLPVQGTTKETTTKPQRLLVTTSLRSVGASPRSATRQPKPPKPPLPLEPVLRGDTGDLPWDDDLPLEPVTQTATKPKRVRHMAGADSATGLMKRFFTALDDAGIPAARTGVGAGNNPMLGAMTALKRKTDPATIRRMIDLYVAEPQYRKADKFEWQGFVFHSARLQESVAGRTEPGVKTREDWLRRST